jgi:hypothetical protein
MNSCSSGIQRQEALDLSFKIPQHFDDGVRQRSGLVLFKGAGYQRSLALKIPLLPESVS